MIYSMGSYNFLRFKSFLNSMIAKQYTVLTLLLF